MKDYFYSLYYTRKLAVCFEKDDNRINCKVFLKPIKIDGSLRQLQSLTLTCDDNVKDITVMRTLLKTIRNNPTKSLLRTLRSENI